MKSDEGIKPADLIELSKLKIMIPVSLTGFLGYFLYDPSFEGNILPVSGGILLMGIAASILNQVQETDIDKKMERTMGRPLPSGKITKNQALAVFILTFSAGAYLILNGGNFSALLVSILTVVWYNGIYTNLKRITAYAVIPGAVTGALPPLIGWIAAGGYPFDIRIVLVQVMFFLGQLPHFWLLVLRYGREYENAGLPSLSAIMSKEQISRLILGMVGSFTIIAILMRMYGVVTSSIIFVLILAFSVLLFRYFFILISGESSGKKPGKYSVLLNVYFISVMVLLITDRLIDRI